MRTSLILLSATLLLIGCSKSSAPPSVVLAPVAGGGESIDLAAAYGDRTKALHTAAEKGQLSLIVELVKKGANPNDKDDAGSTALHKAVVKNQKQATATLLVLGADQGEKDGQGRTPLHIAAAAGNLEVLRLLLGIDTATTLAGDAVKGIGGLVGGQADKTLEKIGYAIGGRSHSAITAADQDGNRPLMLAVSNGHRECFQYLLQAYHPEMLFFQNKKGQNAVMMAAAGGQLAILDDMLATYLLERMPADQFRQTDAAGKTTMQLAEAAGQKKAVRAIWRAQAQVAAMTGDLEMLKLAMAALGNDFPNVEAMAGAASKGKVEVVRILLDGWKDRPLVDKRKLVNQREASEMAFSSLYVAVQGGHHHVVDAVTDLKWWQDPAALSAFIRYAPQSPTGSLSSASAFAKEMKMTEIVTLLDARLAAADAKQK